LLRIFLTLNKFLKLFKSEKKMENVGTVLGWLSAHSLGLQAQRPCRIGPRDWGGPVGVGALGAPEPVTAPDASAVARPAQARRCIFHDEVIP
jgi:hypothetical protein